MGENHFSGMCFPFNQLESHYWDGLYINQNNPGKGRR